MNLFEAIKNDNNEKSLIGYTTNDYDILINNLKNTGAIFIDGSPQRISIEPGTYIPALDDIVNAEEDLSKIELTTEKFSVDRDKKLVGLSFYPVRGFPAIDNKTGTYTMVRPQRFFEEREENGNSLSGKFTSPPSVSRLSVVDASKDNSNDGNYKVGCSVDCRGMLKEYFIYFYPNEDISNGLINGNIKSYNLEKLVGAGCLYAEIHTGKKTFVLPVTDSCCMSSSNSYYMCIDTPICTLADYADIFKTNLDKEFESVFLNSKYDYKTGTLENCNYNMYSYYFKNNPHKTYATKEVQISCIENNLLVKFFCPDDKRIDAENILGSLPKDFFKISQSSTVINDGITVKGPEFVRGEVQKARESFYENNGPVSEDILKKMYNAYLELESYRKNKDFFKEIYTGEFTIPSGYPICLGHRFFKNDINRNTVFGHILKTERKKSTLTDNRIIDNGGNGVCEALWRGYVDEIYEELNDLAQGEIIIATNKYFGNFMSTLLECIMSFYGGENLLKIAPSLCVLSSNIRVGNSAPGHRLGRAFDFDYKNNNIGSWKSGKSYFKAGEKTFYKGFFEIIKAGKHGRYPVRTKDGSDDPMHFQWIVRDDG